MMEILPLSQMDRVWAMNSDKSAGGKTTASGEDLAKDLGEASYGRRLSDKILAAFNHAYAQGRRDIADQLLQSLNLCRDLEGADRVSGALEQARLWMFYVKARDGFLAKEEAGDATADDARQAMLEAHLAWQTAREQT
jgi:hypothetical protein